MATSNVRVKLENVKKHLEQLLDHEIVWYFAENKMDHVEDSYVILTYTAAPHFGDSQDHYNTVTLTLYTIGLDDVEDVMLHDGWTMGGQPIADEKLANNLSFTKRIIIM